MIDCPVHVFYSTMLVEQSWEMKVETFLRLLLDMYLTQCINSIRVSTPLVLPIWCCVILLTTFALTVACLARIQTGSVWSWRNFLFKLWRTSPLDVWVCFQDDAIQMINLLIWLAEIVKSDRSYFIVSYITIVS